jgi:hypothetical protein
MFPVINEFSTVSSPISAIGDAVDGDTIDNGFRFNDTLTWIHGKHEIKFGYEQWYQQYSPLDFSNTSGTFTFSNNETSTFGIVAGAPTAALDVRNQLGHSVASTLLGQTDSGGYSVIQTQPRFLRSYFGGFIQDSFKMTPHLTLNLGLRYEIDEPFKEASDNMSELRFNIPNCNSFTPVCPTDPSLLGGLEFAGKGPGRNGVTNERWAEIYKKNIGPRIGFAYSPAFFGADRTVIRGGYGIIYGGLQYADFGGHGRQGFRGSAGTSSPNGFTPAYSIDSGFPIPAPSLPNLDPSQVNYQQCCAEATILPSYGRPPMIQNWSFEVQRELTTDMILDVAYVGQHSQNLRTNYDGENLLNPKNFSLGTLLNDPLNTQSTVSAPFPGFDPNRTTGQALLPHPQFFSINTDGQLENLGQSTYNALEAQLTRRFRNGLNLMASYTYSKTLTNADAALPFFATLHQGGAPQNFYNRNGDKSVSNQDLTHNLVISYLYQLPFGKGKKILGNTNGVVDRVVGGWQIGGIQRYESGQPLALGCARAPFDYTECIRFNQVPGTSVYNPAFQSGSWNPITDPVINAAAFDDPNSPAHLSSRGTYVFGTVPRVYGNVRMKPYLSEDFSFIKRTKITEKSDLNLQITMINAFNRHIWNRPPDLNPNDGSFGLLPITNFSNIGGGSYLLLPRKLQLQLKFEF